MFSYFVLGTCSFCRSSIVKNHIMLYQYKSRFKLLITCSGVTHNGEKTKMSTLFIQQVPVKHGGYILLKPNPTNELTRHHAFYLSCYFFVFVTVIYK